MTKTIKFKIDEDMKFLPPIVPASKALPDWYKNAPQSMPDAPAWDSGTYRTCMPFFDAMTQGYIMPLWADLYVSPGPMNEETGLHSPTFTWNPMGVTLTITSHRPEQTAGIPAVEQGSTGHAFKLVSPWVMQTPKDYSVLYVPPLNNRDSRLEIISGAVCTDEYVNRVNFPFVWNAPHDYEGLIEQGTPIAQIIPYKREAFKHEIVYMTDNDKVEANAVFNAVTSQFRGAYKRLYRKKSISR